jgi:hypothetical protein
MWGFVGKCGICGETPALRILVSSEEKQKIKSHLADTRVSLEHPKSGNLCENVSLLLERQMNLILPKIV